MCTQSAQCSVSSLYSLRVIERVLCCSKNIHKSSVVFIERLGRGRVVCMIRVWESGHECCVTRAMTMMENGERKLSTTVNVDNGKGVIKTTDCDGQSWSFCIEKTELCKLNGRSISLDFYVIDVCMFSTKVPFFLLFIFFK